MIISLLITAKGRTWLMRKTLPSAIASANLSPPMEILVLNYDSPDDMEEYVEEIRPTISPDNFLTYIKIENKPYWHMAHARNVAIKAAQGEFIVLTSTEIGYSEDFFSDMRMRLNRGAKFVSSAWSGGVIVCTKEDAIAMGGFDERFEYYSLEDKDFSERLHMRGVEPFERFSIHRTFSIDGEHTDEQRFAYYRPMREGKGRPSKREMWKVNKVFYEENLANKVLVVNEGIEWGKV